MKLENGEISNSQLMFLVASFLQGAILTINLTYSITKHDTWLAAIVAFVITFLITLVYLFMAQRFPGKNLIEINDIVFGPYLGKIISVMYLWFFLQLIIHYTFFFSSFWIGFIMPETPRIVIMIMFIILCALTVRKGIEVIARCSFLFTIIVILSALAVTFLSWGDIKLRNLLPIFEIKPIDLIHSTQIFVGISLCENILLLMIIPYTSNNRKIKKPVLAGLCMSAALLLVVAVRDAAVLGPRLNISASASFAVARQIDIANILTRMDILFAITILITMFMKITVFYYVTVLGTAQLFKQHSYIPLSLPIGMLALALAGKLYESDMEQVYAGMSVWPFHTIIYEFILPLITFIVIGIRRLPKKHGGGKCG